MATAATTMFSLQTVKDYLGVTGAGDDALLETIADGVSDRIEKAAGRVFVQRTLTEYHDAQGKDRALLHQYPVASVISVKRRASFDSAWETLTAYEIDTRTGWLYLNRENFYSGPRTAEIVYVAGFDVQDGAGLPRDARQLALDFVKYCYDRRKNSAVLAGTVSVGPASMVIVPDLPRDIKDALQRWRKVRW